MRYVLLLLALAFSLNAASPCQGKIDLGPAYVHLDVLESGKKVRSLDLYGGRLDCNILVWGGVIIKPSVLVATHDADIQTGTLGIGHCLPVWDNVILTPVVGFASTNYRSSVDIPAFGLESVREKIRSNGYYIGGDLSWKFWNCWRVVGVYQYTWSYVRTRIGKLLKSHDHTSGSNYAILLERDINDEFSINIGFGYNTSLTHEKHGLRAKGVKIGFAHWF